MNGDKVDFADIVIHVDEATGMNQWQTLRVYTGMMFLLNYRLVLQLEEVAVCKGFRQSCNMSISMFVFNVETTTEFVDNQPDFISISECYRSDNGSCKQIDASQAGGGREGLEFSGTSWEDCNFPLPSVK